VREWFCAAQAAADTCRTTGAGRRRRPSFSFLPASMPSLFTDEKRKPPACPVIRRGFEIVGRGRLVTQPTRIRGTVSPPGAQGLRGVAPHRAQRASGRGLRERFSSGPANLNQSPPEAAFGSPRWDGWSSQADDRCPGIRRRWFGVPRELSDCCYYPPDNLHPPRRQYRVSYAHDGNRSTPRHAKRAAEAGLPRPGPASARSKVSSAHVRSPGRDDLVCPPSSTPSRTGDPAPARAARTSANTSPPAGDSLI